MRTTQTNEIEQFLQYLQINFVCQKQERSSIQIWVWQKTL
jgi:hypothetical protein